MEARTKTEMMASVIAGRSLETFHHIDLGIFNVTVLRAYIKKNPKFPAFKCKFSDVRMEAKVGHLDPMQWLIGNREIDYARAASLTDDQLKEPVIHVLCPAGTNGDEETHLLIDGIHRIFERHRRGKSFFRYHLFPLAVCPLVDTTGFVHVPWGEKDVIPGLGLVPRRTTVV